MEANQLKKELKESVSSIWIGTCKTLRFSIPLTIHRAIINLSTQESREVDEFSSGYQSVDANEARVTNLLQTVDILLKFSLQPLIFPQQQFPRTENAIFPTFHPFHWKSTHLREICKQISSGNWRQTSSFTNNFQRLGTLGNFPTKHLTIFQALVLVNVRKFTGGKFTLKTDTFAVFAQSLPTPDRCRVMIDTFECFPSRQRKSVGIFPRSWWNRLGKSSFSSMGVWSLVFSRKRLYGWSSVCRK